MKDLAGKVAFVTGGASGIGLGIARAFLDAGMSVAIGDVSQSHLDEAMLELATGEGRVHPVLVDVTNALQLEHAATETARVFGRVHILVNNAGVQNPATLSDTSRQEWDRIMSVNVGGIFNGVRAFLPRIREHSDGGHIVTTASMLGLFTAGSGYGAYCASKFAAVGMMETLRAELAPSNVGVSILCPGPVRSNLEKFLKEYTLALDPMEVGRMVVRGIQRNALYILTHPEFKAFIQYRHDAILASTPADVEPSAERVALAQSVLHGSIYQTECRRNARTDDEKSTCLYPRKGEEG